MNFEVSSMIRAAGTAVSLKLASGQGIDSPLMKWVGKALASMGFLNMPDVLTETLTEFWEANHLDKFEEDKLKLFSLRASRRGRSEPRDQLPGRHSSILNCLRAHDVIRCLRQTGRGTSCYQLLGNRNPFEFNPFRKKSAFTSSMPLPFGVSTSGKQLLLSVVFWYKLSCTSRSTSRLYERFLAKTHQHKLS